MSYLESKGVDSQGLYSICRVLPNSLTENISRTRLSMHEGITSVGRYLSLLETINHFEGFGQIVTLCMLTVTTA